MNEKLMVWEENVRFKRKYDIDQIIENSNGLTVYLMSTDGTEKITLEYNVVVCSYKNTEESFWINTLDEMEKIYGISYLTKNTFFEVEHSTYIKEIENGCYGAVKSTDLFHLKIVAANAILDIISFGKPLIKKN